MKSARLLGRRLGGAMLVLAAAWAGACSSTTGASDAGADAGSDTSTGVLPGDAAKDTAPTVLGCGVTLPATYDTSGLATNAAPQRDLRAHLEGLETLMRSTEGTSAVTASAAELNPLLDEGNPSLRAATSAEARARVDAYVAAFIAAQGQTWEPTDPPPANGGKYAATYHFNAVGIDLREALQKVMLGSTLYTQALAVPLDAAAADKLLTLYGASAKLARNTSADASADERDKLIAEYAAKRDDPSAATGPYRKMKDALLTLKATAGSLEACKQEREAARKTFFAEWERVTFATAVYYLASVVTKLSDPAPNFPSALHSFGEAAGLVLGFRGVPASSRTITDAQLDLLSSKLGDATPYKLKTATTDQLPKLAEAIVEIGKVYGFSPAELESFKKNF